MHPHTRALFMHIFCCALCVSAENIVFPPDAGIIDVTKAPYNIDRTGATDITDTLQAILDQWPNSGAIIYLPNGTYLVSDTVKWPDGSTKGNASWGYRYKNVIMQGQSRDSTIIRLKDNCPGYQDPENRRPVMYTGYAPAQCFRNAIRNLTVNTGSGNPGASGIQFMANNQGCMRDVAIVSGDGRGVAGLDMAFCNEIGPLLVKGLKVEGFDYGVWTSRVVNSMTLEYIELRNQRVCAFLNSGQVVSIRKMTSYNSVPALRNDPYKDTLSGFVTIIESNLNGSGAARDTAAIINYGKMFARDVSTPGYKTALKNHLGTAASIADTVVSEFSSHGHVSLFPSPARSLRLAVKETPDVAWDALANWQRVDTAGNSNDIGPALQAAIDAGRTTVYVPRGSYDIKSMVYVRNNVRRIIGCEARLALRDGFAGEPLFKIIDGAHDTVVIERFWDNLDGPKGLEPQVENASSRTLVMKSMSGFRAIATGSGDIFLEDIVGGPVHINNPLAHVWARQLNIENIEYKGPNIVNTGGFLWVLGFKKEKEATILKNTGGAFSEMLGIFSYTMSDNAGELEVDDTSATDPTPMFINDESAVSLGVAELNPGTQYSFYVVMRETRDGVTDTLFRGEPPRHLKQGALMTLYTGYSETDAARPAARISAPAAHRSTCAKVHFGRRQAVCFGPRAKAVRMFDIRGRLVAHYARETEGKQIRIDSGKGAKGIGIYAIEYAP